MTSAGDVPIAVVIPTMRGANAQIERVMPQLPENGRLIVVFAAARAGAQLPMPDVRDARLILLSAVRPLNAAAARNVGVAAADGARILAFTDDDDAVSEHWLRELTRPLLDGVADITGGVLELRSGHSIKVVRPAVDYWFRQAVFGGNLALTAQAWEKLKGFREDFSSCEDTDLAWRAGAVGLRVAVAEQARVLCATRSAVHEWQQRFRWGRGSVALLKAHGVSLRQLPSLRDLVEDKTQSGYCASPRGAAAAQWLGQSWQRLLG